jgi:hypothetical protein
MKVIKTNEEIELLLQSILSALYPQCEIGWNEWSSYAANGEWF